ncbi:hypothetical protein OG21DRAFT_884357 [Imleria badia]|nr:hypothetical protein OG21DRAFT_884357 [Imleria badia]
MEMVRCVDTVGRCSGVYFNHSMGTQDIMTEHPIYFSGLVLAFMMSKEPILCCRSEGWLTRTVGGEELEQPWLGPGC